MIKNIHQPKISKLKQIELEDLKQKLRIKPLEKLEKPIDYLHSSRNRYAIL